MADGQTRGATVSVAGKGRNYTTLNRPLQLLYPLEINHPPGEATNSTAESGSPDTAESGEPEVAEKPQRLQRASARKGEERRRAWIAQLNSD